MKILSPAAGLLCLLSLPSLAGVSVGGTRLVFNGGDKEASISVMNADKDHAYLIQSWAEMPGPGTEKAPFLVTPPLFRLDAEQQNILRVIRTSGTLPTDRESLFWLNIKAIPAIPQNMQGKNILQFSVKNRLKLFYRPSGLSGSPENAASALTWSREGTRIAAKNNSGYFVNLSSVSLNGKKVSVDYSNNTIPPFSTGSLSLAGGGGGDVQWTVLNDYGAISPVYHTVMQ